ncbi:MAG: hypothetical protein LBR84_12015, partial [Tannerella sp.]|nr:hypothetical protein [Tannerella sp.]
MEVELLNCYSDLRKEISESVRRNCGHRVRRRKGLLNLSGLIALAMTILSLGTTYGQIGGAFVSKQAIGGTFAKNATLRLYIQASSPDGGYVTYQWWRTQDTVPQSVVSSFTNPLSNTDILDIKTNYNAV